MLMRSALFWGITQRRMVILYRRFGTTYRSYLQGSRNPKRVVSSTLPTLLELLDPWRWSRYVVPKRRQRITIRRCVIPQKSADLKDIHIQYLFLPKNQNHCNKKLSEFSGSRKTRQVVATAKACATRCAEFKSTLNFSVHNIVLAYRY
jgi:hypothetical protein